MDRTQAQAILTNQINVPVALAQAVIEFIVSQYRTAAAASAAWDTGRPNSAGTWANRITNLKAAILTARREGLDTIGNGRAAMLDSRARHESTGGYSDKAREWMRGFLAQEMGTKATPARIGVAMQARAEEMVERYNLHLAEKAAAEAAAAGEPAPKAPRKGRK